MAKRRKQYRGVTSRKGSMLTAVSFVGTVKRGRKYVDLALADGNCERAIVGVVGMARDAGMAAAYRYESGKTRLRHRDPVANAVTRTLSKVMRECRLPRNWKEWK